MAEGVRVIVLLAAEPPKTMPETGSKAVLDEVAERVRLPTAVSVSPTVKLIADVAVSSFMVWSVSTERVGAVLGALLTVKVKEVLAVPELASLTVIVTVDIPV